MPFAYYAKLSPARQRIYRRSDTIETLPLPAGVMAGEIVAGIRDGLAGEDVKAVQRGCQALIDVLVAGYRVPPIRIRVLADLAFARAFGFGAKLCIHPRQVGVSRNAMQPTEDEIAWARKVLVAAERSEGAVQVDGKMVDRPVIRKAQSIVDRAAD